MRSKLIASLAGSALIASSVAFTALPASAAPVAGSGSPAATTTTLPTGSISPVQIPTTAIGNLGTLTNATFTPTSFTNQNGQLQVTGLLTGTVTNTVTGVVSQLSQTVSAVVQGATANGSCTILTLDVGAIHLNLLGLNVDLAPIHLNITAQSGNGNLLGNLLCSVANLLNGGNLGGLANLLNQLIGAL